MHSHLWLIPFLEYFPTFSDDSKAGWEFHVRMAGAGIGLAITIDLRDRFAVISGDGGGQAQAIWQMCREKGVTRVFAEPSFLASLRESLGSAFDAEARARRKYIYRLKPGELRIAADTSFRRAREGDFELLVKWYEAFVREENILVSDDYLKVLMSGALYVYLSGSRIVSMVRIPVIGTKYAKISAIFTPPEERGKGYATQLQADVSSVFLGRRLSMITDPEDKNTASIRCYEKIGFSRIGEEISIYPNW